MNRPTQTKYQEYKSKALTLDTFIENLLNKDNLTVFNTTLGTSKTIIFDKEKGTFKIGESL